MSKIKKVANFEIGEEVVICPQYSHKDNRGLSAKIISFSDFITVQLALPASAGTRHTYTTQMWNIKKKSHCRACPLRLVRMTTAKCPLRWQDIKGEQ